MGQRGHRGHICFVSAHNVFESVQNFSLYYFHCTPDSRTASCFAHQHIIRSAALRSRSRSALQFMTTLRADKKTGKEGFLQYKKKDCEECLHGTSPVLSGTNHEGLMDHGVRLPLCIRLHAGECGRKNRLQF